MRVELRRDRPDGPVLGVVEARDLGLDLGRRLHGASRSRADAGVAAQARAIIAVASAATARPARDREPAARTDSAGRAVDGARKRGGRRARRCRLGVGIVVRLSLIGSLALARDRAGTRRRRIEGRAHACHRGKKTRSVIRHAVALLGADATTTVTLTIAVIELALDRAPVPSARASLGGRARGHLARGPAEPLPAIAGPADPEHDLAERTALEAKLRGVVHRQSARGRKTCSGTPAASIVCSKPASIG
jgi:hypothetical protein